jgi:DNA-directed RNA polymerase sigma subunit (sigma70/sigma32)
MGAGRDEGGVAEYLWPGDAGWPEADSDEPASEEVIDLTGEIDLDALCLHAPPPHLWDDLTTTERRVLTARFGLDGTAGRTMKELHDELGLSRQHVHDALESALAKLRQRLTV